MKLGYESLYYQGLGVRVSRTSDGVLVVGIETGDLEGKDVHPGHGEVPRLRVRINEAYYFVSRTGDLIEETPDGPGLDD
jgi:hypothetical protein